MKTSKSEERQQFMRDLLLYIAQHPILEQDNSYADATDEEVRAFIRLFMQPTLRRTNAMTSYGLKHAAERTIGYIFHGDSAYNYVSNYQFKTIMREDEFSHFYPKQEDEDSPNDIYAFRWRAGAEDLMYAFGVYGAEQPSLREKIKELHPEA